MTLSTKNQFHYHPDVTNTDYAAKLSSQETKITYNFFNHFHPSVGKLVEKLNKESLAGLFDVNFQISLADDFFKADYGPNESDPKLEVNYDDTKTALDLSVEGAYSVYNWELFFHAPIATAINLSKNQRFEEAQKWFHYIFDPTSNDQTVPSPMRFWKFRQFRETVKVQQIDELFRELNHDPESTNSKQFTSSIEDWRSYPFQPHRIARTRFLAYQFNVVMKYLDNLISWGDSLFRQDTIETINEATQIYILAANILGPKPQQSPRLGKTSFRTYASLKKNLDPFGNALVEMEGYFPFNLSMPSTGSPSASETNPLFGIAKTLYFCIPKNDNLLVYWYTVADRLFKIRHCTNIEGIVRQLPLFEPPIDPGMLVKAAAAGIDIGSLVSGMYQPLSLVRTPLVIQKALEICNEVKFLGNALLSALEKKDAEELSLLRQEHEINILQLVEDVKFLQWKEAEAATQALWYTRNTTYQRYQHYQLILEKINPDLAKVKDLTIVKKDLNQDNFDEFYAGLVSQFGKIIDLAGYRKEQTSNDLVDQVASIGSGLLGSGDGANLQLNVGESKELNTFMPLAHELQNQSSASDVIALALSLIPQVNAHGTPLGVGAALGFGGVQLSKYAELGSKMLRLAADEMNYRANRASKLASFQRRIDEWVLQNNLAASELMQIGRQIISSLIREQISKKEYDNHKEQIKNAKDIETLLNTKFTNHDLYIWIQGEISRVYYDCYKFAFDVAKKAEQVMKYDLMSEELDDIDFVKFNYWDSGRNGLLSGEGLYLDLKRMEMAYHDHNKREYEITKHISLQQLDPKSLLQLKATGSCQITIPEWLFDMDCPGHYMRRIKTVSLSIPCVAGPYTSINCTLSLLKNTIRKSPIISDGYARSTDVEDPRFKDYFGTIQSIVTSNAQVDSGLFETNLRDERYLPFEGAGAESTWKLELPSDFKQFDYNTISDVILHLRYTSREGGAQLKSESISHIKTDIVKDEKASGMIRSFSLKHDFPTEWYKFISSREDLKIVVKKDYFPYISMGFKITISKVELFAIKDGGLKGRIFAGPKINMDDLGRLSTEINDIHKDNQSELAIMPDKEVLTRDEKEQVFLAMSYSLD
jgi:hypothetical protein